MIDIYYNLAKNQVFAFFHSCVICRSVSPKFIELCMAAVKLQIHLSLSFAIEMKNYGSRDPTH